MVVPSERGFKRRARRRMLRWKISTANAVYRAGPRGVMSESDWFYLDDDEFKAILRLVREYHREAVRCENAKVYLAGCVMVGAALEAALLAMVHLSGPAVESAGLTGKKVKGAPKHVLKWSLAELVRTARK